MQALKPLQHQVSIGLVALAAVLHAKAAAADDKQACGEAYEKTQSLRREGKLQAAREQAVACTRDVCAEFVRTDCATWLGQIEASQPSVVLQVRDAAGRDVTTVRVLLDGQPWLPSVDVNAHPIDPGSHTLRFEADGEAPVEQPLVVREGDKNLRVSVQLGAPAAPLAPTTAPGPAAPTRAPEETTSERSVAPWIIGGVGVASLAVGAILGVVVLGEKATFDEHCSEATETCDGEGIAARDSGETLGPISTVSLILGGVGVGVAAVWLITDSSGEGTDAASVGTGPVATPSGAAWQLKGRF